MNPLDILVRSIQSQRNTKKHKRNTHWSAHNFHDETGVLLATLFPDVGDEPFFLVPEVFRSSSNSGTRKKGSSPPQFPSLRVGREMSIAAEQQLLFVLADGSKVSWPDPQVMLLSTKRKKI
jgi:hypothetical protein